MTQQQRYEVVRQWTGFELRSYQAHVIAEVEIEGSFESAGSAAFRPLVSYIGGRNVEGRGLAMTAPVLQREGDTVDPGSASTSGEVTPSGRGTFLISFVMPDSEVFESMPAPTDARVVIRPVAQEYAVAARYSGRWSRSAFEGHAARLLAAAEAAGFEVTGAPRFARFDPPWTPWFSRRNEVVIPVRGV